MTLRHMEIFRALCRNDFNTTKTAHALNMTQPAVSLAIKELENHYGIQLFDRIGKKLVITMAGRRFEEYTNSIESLFADMECEMKNWDKHGLIRVGATLTIGAKFLPFYTKQFQGSYPNTNIKGFCGPANVLEQKILNNELDFAFSEGIANDPSIVSEPYMDDHLVVFCVPNGRYRQGEKITLDEFKKNNFVLREVGSGTRKVFDLACEKQGFKVEPVWEAMSNTSIINAVCQDIGLGCISYRLVDWAQKAGLINIIKVEGLDLSRKFYVIRHKEKKLSTAAKYFLYLCNEINFEVPDNL